MVCKPFYVDIERLRIIHRVDDVRPRCNDRRVNIMAYGLAESRLTPARRGDS